MAVIQKSGAGAAAVGVAWGVASTGYTYTGAATVLKAAPLAENITKSAQMVAVPDKNGETIGMVYYNPIKELELRVYPSDTTLALSSTAGGLTPAIGDKFVVTAASDPDIAGNYLVEKVGKARKTDGYVEFDISLKQYPTDLTTTVA